ncbi:hypothetical protein [Ornithinimicrobium sp. INDO-MA30-4]|uniref:hypothetical protein n=1 Tax=Ornithinimicrobium sp. INDO-MA30-4 TaxID=2908651 RepID=UPI001F3DD518|nr:hypothetical protein [Ornithinimicrobium sp. INDO-MA30-4]UJH71819.1 hypothetical protein L0A91_16585 [Ornithinimicrobium sp. INDO-MA30-4]
MTPVSMPAAGYRRPDRLDPTRLVVSVIGTDGQEAGPFDFSQARPTVRYANNWSTRSRRPPDLTAGGAQPRR